jgi:6-phosphogluconolactonase/glucosamine-6-phosphate isomerase/deaminase
LPAVSSALAAELDTLLAARRTAAATERSPTLALAGGASPAAMQDVAAAIPDIESRTLEGQSHAVVDEILIRVLSEFFTPTPP